MKHHPPYKPIPPGWNRPVYTVTFYSIARKLVTTVAQYDRKFAAIEAARAFVRGHLEAERTLTYRGIDDGFQVCRGDLIVAHATFRQTKKAQPTCDCSNHERQVCDICQGVDPALPGSERTVATIVDNLTADEVKEAVKNIHRMHLIPDGPGVEPAIEFALRCQAEVAKIEERGWRLGLSLSTHTQVFAKGGGKWLLKSPRKVFHVLYAFYKITSSADGNLTTKVLFHISECSTKREALERISKCPAPTHNRDKAT
jgi:hypothetical protein